MRENAKTSHIIKSIRISGGFLNGASLQFDEHLNCIIGGRGTGKTTVLEFIRVALQTDSILDQRSQGNEVLELKKWFPASQGAISTVGGSVIGRDCSYFMLLIPLNR